MFGFLKRCKFRAVRFAELRIRWMSDSCDTTLSVIFYENGNGRRKYIVSGHNQKHFCRTEYYAPCETWLHTGLFPEWSKDPLAEKLSR